MRKAADQALPKSHAHTSIKKINDQGRDETLNGDLTGIIDIGSNTIRLVIYKTNQRGNLKEIENVKVVARLRNYLSEYGLLTEDGILKLIKILQSFQEVTRSYSLTNVKCVATATIRQANNKEVILARVKRETDYSMVILSEYEEANYGFLAVVHTTPYEEGITVDIGGASTEITYFKDRKLVHFHSFPFGALSLKKQFIKGDIPTPDEMIVLKSFLQEQFSTLNWIQQKQVPLIGIGGSARNMVQIHQEFIDYPVAGVHQYKMKTQEIHHLNQTLQKMTYTEIQRLEGLSKDRADIIIPAVEVFSTLLVMINTDTFSLSQKGLREGIYFEESSKSKPVPNVLNESLNELAIDYQIVREDALERQKLAVCIAQLLMHEGLLSFNEQDEERLKRSSFVYNLGSYIDRESSSQHTFYILANRTINGMDHRERIVTALLASYKNKSAFKRYMRPFAHWFTKEEGAKLRMMGAMIKFAHCLDATKRKIIQNITIQNNREELTFLIHCSKDWQPEIYQVEKQKKHLEKQLGKSITVKFFGDTQ
ncbi:Ppx/GppA family phosphatase [Mesobacillus maritimus]|uniref:Ppx/GppA family phosphatase n=1 Tax=Mesobacillus maritimus TaxID=1643336 RepID=UPI0032E7F71F